MCLYIINEGFVIERVHGKVLALRICSTYSEEDHFLIWSSISNLWHSFGYTVVVVGLDFGPASGDLIQFGSQNWSFHQVHTYYGRSNNLAVIGTVQ